MKIWIKEKINANITHFHFSRFLLPLSKYRYFLNITIIIKKHFAFFFPLLCKYFPQPCYIALTILIFNINSLGQWHRNLLPPWAMNFLFFLKITDNMKINKINTCSFFYLLDYCCRINFCGTTRSKGFNIFMAFNTSHQCVFQREFFFKKN